jgi:hypothetical protein
MQSTTSPNGREARKDGLMLATILSTDTFGVIEREGMALKVVARSWPAGTDVDAVIANTIAAESASLSSDGRTWLSEWHTGAESADAAYVERWTADGRVFHGWVDAQSRKIVQAG